MLSRTLGRLAPVAVVLLFSACTGEEPVAPPADLMGALTPGGQLAAPSHVAAAVGPDGVVTVTWRDNSGNETRFDVLRSNGSPTQGFSLHGRTAANVSTYRDVNVASPFDYCYQVRAARERGGNTSVSAPSAPVCVLGPLVAPSNVRAVAMAEGEVVVTWQDNSGDETGFEVLRDNQGAALASVARTGANVTSIADAGVVPGTTYCYHVRVFRGPGNYSELATAACAQAMAPVPKAARLDRVSPTHSHGVQLYFVDGSYAYDDTSRIDRSTDGGATWVVAGTVRVGWEGFFYDDGLESERAVCYRVVTVNTVGAGAPSNTRCTTPPAEPTEVTITTIDASSFDLTWRDNSAAEDGFEVRGLFIDCWRDWDGQEYCDANEYAVATLPAGTTSFRVSDMYAREWRVYAMKDGGYGSGGGVVTP